MSLAEAREIICAVRFSVICKRVSTETRTGALYALRKPTKPSLMNSFNKLGLAALALAMSIPVWGQNRTCSSMEVLQNNLQASPERIEVMRQIEEHTQNFDPSTMRSSSAVVTIPTVVHVIYSNSTENISDAQVLSQIQILTDDFRRLNADADGTWSQAADTEIEFCLATIDPSGNPTTGITRTSTSVSSFGPSDGMKFNSSGGKDAWPTDEYLNIWVCDLSSGLLGYAQFPGSGSASTDGIVCDYAYFGNTGVATPPFDLGRTATHEVGHWLNLRHIWGDGGCSASDFVSDTPNSDGPNYGCALGNVACSTVDMVQNYMDYSDDDCMNLFTAGQATRMQAVLSPGGFRSNLLNSPGCGTPAPPTCTDGIQNGDETGIDCGGSTCPPCPPCTDVVVSINLDNYPEETSWDITNSSGVVVASGGTYGSLPDGSNVTVTECLNDGCYDFTIFDSFGDGICCGFGSGDYTVSVGGAIVASGGSFDSAETTNFCIGGGTSCSTTSAPDNLNSSISGGNLTLSWDPIPLSEGCQVSGSQVTPPGPSGNSTVVGFEPSSLTVPLSFFASGSTWNWSVRCACSLSPVTPTPSSATSSFSIPAPRVGDLGDAVSIAPNPTAGNSWILYTAGQEGQVDIRVVDMLGRTMLAQQSAVFFGDNRIELETSELANGQYQVEIIHESAMTIRQIIIER